MQDTYHALVHRTLPSETRIHQPYTSLAGPLTYGDPALRVMTDLKQVMPFTISPFSSLEDANNKMIIAGVRLLFVTGSNGTLIGLITATDLLGEKPVLYLHEHGGSRETIQVQDIMTPANELEALDFHEVERATVGDIVKTLEQCGRQHLIVYQACAGKDCIVRGIFSSTQLSRQLGTPLALAPRANTFAQLNRAIGH